VRHSSQQTPSGASPQLPNLGDLRRARWSIERYFNTSYALLLVRLQRKWRELESKIQPDLSEADEDFDA
jgi:hypothetical protein